MFTLKFKYNDVVSKITTENKDKNFPIYSENFENSLSFTSIYDFRTKTTVNKIGKNDNVAGVLNAIFNMSIKQFNNNEMTKLNEYIKDKVEYSELPASVEIIKKYIEEKITDPYISRYYLKHLKDEYTFQKVFIFMSAIAHRVTNNTRFTNIDKFYSKLHKYIITEYIEKIPNYNICIVTLTNSMFINNIHTFTYINDTLSDIDTQIKDKITQSSTFDVSNGIDIYYIGLIELNNKHSSRYEIFTSLMRSINYILINSNSKNISAAKTIVDNYTSYNDDTIKEKLQNIEDLGLRDTYYYKIMKLTQEKKRVLNFDDTYPPMYIPDSILQIQQTFDTYIMDIQSMDINGLIEFVFVYMKTNLSFIKIETNDKYSPIVVESLIIEILVKFGDIKETKNLRLLFFKIKSVNIDSFINKKSNYDATLSFITYNINSIIKVRDKSTEIDKAMCKLLTYLYEMLYKMDLRSLPNTEYTTIINIISPIINFNNYKLSNNIVTSIQKLLTTDKK